MMLSDLQSLSSVPESPLQLLTVSCTGHLCAHAEHSFLLWPSSQSLSLRDAWHLGQLQIYESLNILINADQTLNRIVHLKIKNLLLLFSLICRMNPLWFSYGTQKKIFLKMSQYTIKVSGVQCCFGWTKAFFTIYCSTEERKSQSFWAE